MSQIPTGHNVANTHRARCRKSRVIFNIDRLDYGLVLALILPIFALMPLLTHPGLPNTADGPVHLMRQVELNQAWQQGYFYPRWGTDLALGHGMPIFSYAPPLLYQLTQLFHLFSLPLDESMKAVLVLDFLLYSLGMFLFARRIFGPAPALIAAAVYVYAPYRLREAYIQGNYGQFTGLAFYPLIFWAFHGLITDGRPRYLVAAALSLAGLLLSHNISFMLFAPLFAIYLLLLLILSSYQANNSRFGEKPPLNPPHWGGSSPVLPPAEGVRGGPNLLRGCLTPRLTTSLIRLATGVLLGLGLAAIFWLPAFGERHTIKLEGITRGFFDFRENFISLSEFLSPPLPLDLTAINPEFPLSLGLPQIIGAATGIIALLVLGAKLRLIPRIPQETQVTGHSLPVEQASRAATDTPPEARRHGHASERASRVTDHAARRRHASAGTQASRVTHHASRITFHSSRFTHTLFFSLFFLLYSFLALPQSQFLWESVPFIELTEFPWRMLGPAIFCASVLSAAAFSILTPQTSPLDPKPFRETPHAPRPSPLPPRLIILFLISIFAIIALNAYYLYPSQFIPWGTPTPADAFAYEAGSGAIGTTSTGEFLPRSAQQHPQPDALRADYEAGRPPQKIDPASLPPGATVEILTHLAESDSWQINTPEEFVATIRTLYWPGWQIYLDGQPTVFTVAENTGLIQTTIPAGQHHLRLQLESTPLRAVGRWLTIISFCSLVIIVIFAITKRRSRPAEQRSAVRGQRSRFAWPRFFGLTTLFLIAFYLVSRPLAPLFVWQSDPNQPRPADQILQVDFADQLRLVGMDRLPETAPLQPNGAAHLAATLYWRALQDLQTNYSVFLHLDAPNGQTLATVDEVNPENIPTRNWPPGLYLRNPLSLELPADLPPIRYDVNVGVYNRETGQRLLVLPDQATTFKLGSIWLTPPPPELTGPPLAHFGPHVTLRQAHFENETLVLYWQTTQPLAQNHSIFVHLLDADGHTLAQADGVPYDGLYPLANWRPNQIITDVRPLDSLLENKEKLAAFAIGIYDLTTGERLPATDTDGNMLPHNSFLIPVTL